MKSTVDYGPRVCAIPGCRNLCNRYLPIHVCHQCGIEIARIYWYSDPERNEVQRQERLEGQALREARRADLDRRSIVYYIDLTTHVKIGYTSDIFRRLSGLRADANQILAMEPGGRALEKERHFQFRAERIGRREDFHRSAALDAHIEALVAEHGLPSWTKLPSNKVSIRKKP